MFSVVWVLMKEFLKTYLSANIVLLDISKTHNEW